MTLLGTVQLQFPTFAKVRIVSPFDAVVEVGEHASGAANRTTTTPDPPAPPPATPLSPPPPPPVFAVAVAVPFAFTLYVVGAPPPPDAVP